MVATGIIVSRLPADNEVVCHIKDPALAEVAAAKGITKTMAAVDLWLPRLEGAVVAVGNAPPALFRLLEENAGGGRIALMGVIGEILTHCIQYKANIVAQDEHDTGLRMTLNFGHTIAHAVETCQHYTGMRHGEAVALGMRVITAMTEEKGMTEQGTSARLNRLLDAL